GLLAWVCFRGRRRYDAVFTDGEQVGLPLAVVCRLTLQRAFAHVMIVHIISVPKKTWLYRLLRLGRYVDTAIVYSSVQQRYLADADVVVMPLHDVPFQAGVTTILEAMSMGRAVVCSRSHGQGDVLVDGATGVFVPPGSAEVLRTALEALLAGPDRAARLGAAA